MKLVYHLSDKAVKQLFLNGEEHDEKRIVEFQLGDLTPQARAAWLELYGTNDYRELKAYTVIHGQIYNNGFVERNPPEAATMWDWLVQDAILTPETVSNAILQLLASKRDAEAEAARRFPAWQEAGQRHEQAQAKRDAEAEAVHKAEALMQPTIEKLKKRISELEGYLEALIKASDSETLEKAGLVHGVGEESEEPENTPEQQEALETVGLDC